MNENTKMTVYKDILIKVEQVNYPETMKIAGVPWQDDFGNIGDYHKNYLNKLSNKNTSKENPEMCYFLPLKENREKAEITFWGVQAPDKNPKPAVV